MPKRSGLLTWRLALAPLTILAGLVAATGLLLALRETSLYHPRSAPAIVRSTSAPSLPFNLGDVFAGVGNGHILHFQPSGALVETLNTGSLSNADTGMCFDGAGNLYTTNWTAGNMSKFDNTGTLLTFPWGGAFSLHPESCVVDASGNVYVGEVDGLNRITKFTSSGTLISSWRPAASARGLDWIDLAADQCTMFYTSESSNVKRYNLCTSTQLPDFTTGLNPPCYALRIRGNGEVMVTCQTELVRLSTGGAVLQRYPTTQYPGTSLLFAANLDPNGTSIWTGDYLTGLIYKINIATGAPELHFTAPPQAGSMAGIAIYGELTQGQPTATPGVPPQTATPAPTVTAEGQPTETVVGEASPTENRRTRTPNPTNTPRRTPSSTATPGVTTSTPVPSQTAATSSTPVPTGTHVVSTSTSTAIVSTNTPLPTQTSGGPSATLAPTGTAVPPTATACSIQFSDIPVGSTFYSNIRCLACRGVISGYPDGTFRPSNNVTRGQLSKIVGNAAGFNEPAGSQQYEDVPPASTFFSYIWRLSSRGIISGYPCGGPGEPCVAPDNLPYFRPNNNATRGQITKIVSNAAGLSEEPAGQQFEDVAPGSTYYTYTYRLVIRSTMSGYPCGGPREPCLPPNNLPYFRVNANATRGQTAKIVSNTFFPECQTPQGAYR